MLNFQNVGLIIINFVTIFNASSASVDQNHGGLWFSFHFASTHCNKIYVHIAIIVAYVFIPFGVLLIDQLYFIALL